MAKKYKNIDENTTGIEAKTEESSDFAFSDTDYKIQVSFIELSNTYMHRIPWKWHPEMEIIIINHGTVDFMTNETTEVLTAGEGVIINSNLMHSLKPSTEDYNCSFYSTVFHPDFIFNSSESELYQKYMVPISSPSVFQYLTLNENDEAQSELLEYVNEIIADNLIKKYGYELTTKSRLCMMLSKLLNLVTPQTKPKKKSIGITHDEARAKEIILYIQQNYSSKITLDELAEHINISKSECCRCFKRSIGITPIEYLMKYRILMAVNLIQNSDPRNRFFSDLSSKVGFNNASYFNKLFRQYIGCTPSEYRRKLKNNTVFDPFKI